MGEPASPLSFIFRDEADVDWTSLKQGDLILRTEALRNALNEGHRHYAEHPDYTHFLVLTYSCDLAVRGSTFKATYITLCATKPVEYFIRQRLNDAFSSVGGPIRIGRKQLKRQAESVVDRLISNTSEEVFFIDQFGAKSVSEPICAYLQLSIALHSKHYDTILRAKQAEMEDVFAAKLGWMTGNLYSRVATPDVYEKDPNAASRFKDDLQERYLNDNTYWLPKKQADAYKKRVLEFIDVNHREPTADEAKAILRSCPEPVSEIADAVMSEIQAAEVDLPPEVLAALRKRLQNNAKLKGLAGRAA